MCVRWTQCSLCKLPPSARSVSSTEPGEPPCITSAGFQFLLLDTPAQLWYFMLQYLQTAQVRARASDGWRAPVPLSNSLTPSSCLTSCRSAASFPEPGHGSGGDSFLPFPAQLLHSWQGQ